MNAWRNNIMGEGMEGCQGRFHRGGDTHTRFRRMSWICQVGKTGKSTGDSTACAKEAGNIHEQSSVTEVLDLPKVNYHLYDWARLVNALFSLPYLDPKTSSKISKEGMKEEKKRKILNPEIRAQSHPDSYRRQTAVSRSPWERSGIPLKSNSTSPTSETSLDFWCTVSCCLWGRNILSKERIRANSLVYPLGITLRGSKANPRTKDSPRANQPVCSLKCFHTKPSDLRTWMYIPHGVFLRNKHLIEYKYY